MDNNIIISDKENVRIDKYLGDRLDNVSRAYIQKLINDGNIKVNNKTVKNKYKISIDDVISVDIPEPEEIKVEAENIPIDIVYEDNDIIVVNKKRGMVVHPAPGNYNGTLVNALLYHCKGNLSEINGKIRPGIVHRIDKDTTGLLVVAKNNNAHMKLSEQLKVHSFTRKYVALVYGTIKDSKGTIDMPIGRHPVDRKKMAVNIKNGREAVTHFNVIEIFNNYTLVECKLETGRTHQIRVHLSSIRHPVVGDPVYSKKKDEFNLEGQALHAKTLGFIHPKTNEYIEFNSELPQDFNNVLNILRKTK